VVQCSLQAAITSHARIAAGLVLWCSAHSRRPPFHLMCVLITYLSTEAINRRGLRVCSRQGWCCGAVLTSGGHHFKCVCLSRTLALRQSTGGASGYVVGRVGVVVQCSLQAAIPHARILARADVEAVRLEGPAGLVLWCSAHFRRPPFHMCMLITYLSTEAINRRGLQVCSRQGWCSGAVGPPGL
jgi:hypothetical protein